MLEEGEFMSGAAPAEYLTIELLLSGEADFPAMAVATAVAMTAASCLLSGVMGRIEGPSALSSPSSSRDFFRGPRKLG